MGFEGNRTGARSRRDEFPDINRTANFISPRALPPLEAPSGNLLDSVSELMRSGAGLTGLRRRKRRIGERLDIPDLAGHGEGDLF